MVRKCSVYGCKTGYDSQKDLNTGVMVHGFPKDKNERLNWIRSLPNKLSVDNVTDNMGVCALHWPSSAPRARRGKYLIPSVSPSVFPNVLPSCIPSPSGTFSERVSTSRTSSDVVTGGKCREVLLDMEDNGCIGTPVGFNITVGTSESALPMIKAEEPPGEDMDQSYNVVVGTTPLVKTEPMDVTEEEPAQMQEDAVFPSEASASSPAANIYNGTSPDNHEMPSTETADKQQSISLLWPGETIIKQEPDVEIDHDEGHMVIPEGNMSSPDGYSTHFVQDPHPVMILKRERKENDSTKQLVDGGLENEEDREADAVPGLWTRMLNRKAQCLVCNGTCRVTRNRKIPTLPFCKKCKKAYFYQLSHVVKGVRKQRLTCIRGGNCIIDYRFPKEWCSVCHLRKFKAVLLNYAGFSRAVSFENQLTAMSESEADDKPKRQYRFVRRKPRKGKEVEMQNPPEHPGFIEKELVVRVEKLTKEDLEAYGISDPMAYVSTEEEPLDFTWKPNNGECSDSNEYTLPPLQTKPNFLSSHVAGASMLLPLPRNAEVSPPDVKKRKINNKPKFFPRISLSPKSREKKKSGGKSLSRTPSVNESVASIKVFVFTCGHACGLCNSTDAQRWLQSSGITTTMPHNCKDAASHTPSQSTQMDCEPAVILQSKPESSALHGSVPHLKQLLDRPPEMQFKQHTPPVSSARPPEMHCKQQIPNALSDGRRETRLKRPTPPVQRTPVINHTGVIGHPHPAFPRAVQLGPDVPLINKATIPGQFHLLPVRFSTPLHPPQGPLLLRVPTVSTSGNLPQPLPTSLPPAPVSVQLNTRPPIPPVNASLSALQHDVRLALAKTLMRPTSNLTGTMQARSASLVPPPISLIPVPGNIQLQSPVLVSARPDFSLATSKAISSSQSLHCPSSKISKAKLVSNSVCVSSNSGPISRQKKSRLQWNSAASPGSLKPPANIFSTLPFEKNTSDSSASFAGSNNPSQRRQATADTQCKSDSSQPSADKRHVPKASSDTEQTSGSPQTTPHLEDTEQVSVKMKYTTAFLHQSSDGERMAGLNGTSQPTDDIKHSSGSLQPKPSDDIKLTSGSQQPSDDMECTENASSQQSSSDKEDTTDAQQPSGDIECHSGSAQVADDMESLAGSTKKSYNVETSSGSSQLLNDLEPTTSSPQLLSDNDITPVSPQRPSDKGITAGSMQPLSDKEHTAGSLQLSSDNDNTAVSPHTPSDKEPTIGSPQTLSDKELTSVSPQAPSDKGLTTGSSQTPSDKEHTAGSLILVLPVSSDNDNSAVLPQMPSNKEHTAVSLQLPPDNDNSTVSPQMPSNKGFTSGSLQLSSDNDNTASSPQTSSDKEPALSVSKLSCEKEYTAGSPQPSSVREHAAGSPQLSSDNEHTNSQSSSDKERTEGS